MFRRSVDSGVGEPPAGQSPASAARETPLPRCAGAARRHGHQEADLMDCPICEQIETVASLPGGALVEEPDIVAYHLPPVDRFPVQYLGRLLVVTRRHVPHVGNLMPEEAANVGCAVQKLGAALRALDDVSHVHCAIIGLHVPHFHEHVFPRYRWMPPEADWNSLHERVDAPRGGAEEIGGFVRRLRTNLV